MQHLQPPPLGGKLNGEGVEIEGWLRDTFCFDLRCLVRPLCLLLMPRSFSIRLISLRLARLLFLPWSALVRPSPPTSADAKQMPRSASVRFTPPLVTCAALFPVVDILETRTPSDNPAFT